MSELLRGPVSVANLTAAAGVTTTVDGWWPCLDLTWRTPVPASITKITAQVRERGTTSPVAETVVTAVDLAAGTAKVVNGVSVGQHLEVRLSPAGAPGLPFQATPWVEVTTSWDALIAQLDGLKVGCFTIVCGVGVPTRTDLEQGSLYVREDVSQLWRYDEALAVATSAANIAGTDLKSSGATNVVTLTGFDPANTVRFSKPLAADSDGQLTWDAYSLWPDDSGTTPTPSPVPGETWGNGVSLYGNNGGSDVLLFTAVFPGLDATGAGAFAALAAQMPVSFTGYATYKVVGGIDTNPGDNRGGLSILVEELTPGWVLMSDLTSILANGVEIEGSPRSLDVVDANGVLVATSDGLGGVSLTLNSDTDTTLAANSDAKVATQKAVKAYVTSAVAGAVNGLSWKQAVRAATTANGTDATAFANGQVIDGVTLVTGDRILRKNQTTGSENGIFTVNASGVPTRATDADSGAELVNATVLVSEGTTLADTQWTCTTNAPITVGSTSLAFAQSGSGGSVSDGDKGDVVVSGGGTVWSLDTSGVVAGTYGDSTHVAQIVFDAKGRATGATNVPTSGIAGVAPYAYTQPPFANVSALLHFDGTNGSTTITDVIGGAWTATGTAAISTAQSVYGGASLLVPGSGNSAVKRATSSAFDVGTGNWTIEFRWKYNGAPQSFARIFQSRDGDIVSGIGITVDASGFVFVTLSSNAASNDLLPGTNAVARLGQTGWNSVIIQRRGIYLETFVNGTLATLAAIGEGSIYYNAADTIVIGGNSTSTSRSMNAYIDDFRFTKGAYVMVPGDPGLPTAAFPNS